MTDADFHEAALFRIRSSSPIESVEEIDRFASRSFSADWKEQSLEILESIVGEDVLSYADPVKATQFATQVLSMAAVAAVEGNPKFLHEASNVLRLLAKGHGVKIARGAEQAFADKLGTAMTIAKALFPLLL